MVEARVLGVATATVSCLCLMLTTADVFALSLGSQTLVSSRRNVAGALGNTQFCGLGLQQQSRSCVARVLARRASAGTRRGRSAEHMMFDTLAENMSAAVNLFSGQKTVSESR